MGGTLKKDNLLVLILAVVFIGSIFPGFRLPFLDQLEHLIYDAGVRHTVRMPAATRKIAIIAIDDASMSRLGRWPWSRHVLANMVRRLNAARAKVIGLRLNLFEPQSDPGLVYIRRLKKRIETKRYPRPIEQRYIRPIKQYLKQAELNLDADGILARSLPRRNVYLPIRLKLSKSSKGSRATMPPYLKNSSLKLPRKMREGYLTAANLLLPLPELGRAAAGVGHILSTDTVNGGFRSEPLVVKHQGRLIPSMAMLIAARSLNIRPGKIRINPGKSVRIGKRLIKTDSAMRMYTGFHRPGKGATTAFRTYPFYQVLNGKVRPSTFRNKIVIIGVTAQGLAGTYPTPVNANMTGAELSANIIASLLNGDYYTRPSWLRWAELGLFMLLIAYFLFIFHGLRPGITAFTSFLILMTLFGSEFYLLISQKIWFRSVTPGLFLIAGHLLLASRRFFVTEKLKLSAEKDSAQTNRMLGLAFQGQGQLDMAMDKFRKLPVDKSVLDLIYNLALDFERKRQFSKAVSSYNYIKDHSNRFRDINERRKRAQQAEKAMILGTHMMTPGGTMVLTESMDQKPTLGRYEVVKEIGKGAMGTVYLGRDPKINRVVAIKTLALSQEFEQGDLERVKQRFFREAETAGSLNHPNIVTIYDAGEEHDLAYIAMEYLEGKDLTTYVKSGKILPIRWVLEIADKVADALDYAHRQDVVHRDIKPANIMYNEKNNTVTVTDFGIARITASSKTKTGVVLGTPSYMSPEQLAGQRVDGRTDLFSLGVTLYELLTGKQPFTGDSMAALMYQIANVKHPDITRARADVPACVRKLIDKALHKDPKRRYQTGAELHQAIQDCLPSVPNKGKGSRK